MRALIKDDGQLVRQDTVHVKESWYEKDTTHPDMVKLLADTSRRTRGSHHRYLLEHTHTQRAQLVLAHRSHRAVFFSYPSHMFLVRPSNCPQNPRKLLHKNPRNSP